MGEWEEGDEQEEGEEERRSSGMLRIRTTAVCPPHIGGMVSCVCSNVGRRLHVSHVGDLFLRSVGEPIARTRLYLISLRLSPSTRARPTRARTDIRRTWARDGPLGRRVGRVEGGGASALYDDSNRARVALP
eukprot:2802928-Pyramimonas_sp.AAC.1